MAGRFERVGKFIYGPGIDEPAGMIDVASGQLIEHRSNYRTPLGPTLKYSSWQWQWGRMDIGALRIPGPGARQIENTTCDELMLKWRGDSGETRRR